MFLKNSIIFCFCLFAGVLSAQTATFTVNAGSNQKICPGFSAVLGGSPTAGNGTIPYTYTWVPSASLNNPHTSNPTATPTATTIYTVTVTDGKNIQKSSAVTILVYSYTLDAGQDTNIKAGQTIVLHASAPQYSTAFWAIDSVGGNSGILNQNTLSPDVFPENTTQYTLIATFPGGCTLYDHLTVTVISDEHLYFFNSFSPNQDNVNELFIIGNIGLYPNNTLDIFNRYGQKVFTATDYKNDWNGSYLGNDLPCGTYFYVLDTHDPKGGKYQGEVNIIK